MRNCVLYVAGKTPMSVAALHANLKRLCEGTHGRAQFEIEVIDLIENPRLAKDDQIRCDSHSGAETASAHPQDHRRPVGHRNERWSAYNYVPQRNKKAKT